MSELPESFRAFRIHDDEQGYRSGLETIAPDDLSDGDVTIRVAWSGINYKDALAATGKGKILRRYPLNGGIDAAGIVVESDNEEFQPGDRVLANGSGLSETRDGGFAEFYEDDGEGAAKGAFPYAPTAASFQLAVVEGLFGIVWDAPAEVLYERKKEATLEYLEWRRRVIMEQGATMANFGRVDATQPLDRVLAQVTQLVTEFYASSFQKSSGKSARHIAK